MMIATRASLRSRACRTHSGIGSPLVAMTTDKSSVSLVNGLTRYPLAPMISSSKTSSMLGLADVGIATIFGAISNICPNHSFIG